MSDVAPIPNRPPDRPALPTPDALRAWLDYELEPLVTRRAAVVNALQKTLEAYAGGIADDEQQGIAAENIRMAKALLASRDDAHTAEKKPYLEGGRVVDAWKNRFGVPLDEPMRQLESLMLRYATERERRERAAAQADADRLAAIAAQQKRDADAAAPREGMFGPAAEAAYQAEQDAVAARREADARPADFSRVRGPNLAVASVRQSWAWECPRISDVPRKYLMVNPDAIAAEVRAKGRDPKTGRPLAVIKGIVWVAKRAMGVR